MRGRLRAPPRGLTAGLSRAVVAVVVGLDYEFEHRMRHRTTRGGAVDDAPGGLDLSSGAEPRLRGWRTCAPSPLPEFPMVLHRGGFPDGA